MKTQLSLITFSTAALALGISLFSALRAEPVAEPAPALSRADGVVGRIASLESALNELREEISRKTVLSAPVDSREPALPASALKSLEEELIASVLASVDDRVREVERRIDSSEETRTVREDALRMGLMRRASSNLTELKRAAIDPGATEAAKLQALRGLRGQVNELGEDARDADVVTAMIELARSTESQAARADVYRQMHRVTDPRFMHALLDSLAHDPSEEVREEAAESLDVFLPDAAVHAALEYAAQNDSSLDVRRQALESME